MSLIKKLKAMENTKEITVGKNYYLNIDETMQVEVTAVHGDAVQMRVLKDWHQGYMSHTKGETITCDPNRFHDHYIECKAI